MSRARVRKSRRFPIAATNFRRGIMNQMPG
jgi:hypothetical protein